MAKITIKKFNDLWQQWMQELTGLNAGDSHSAMQFKVCSGIFSRKEIENKHYFQLDVSQSLKKHKVDSNLSGMRIACRSDINFCGVNLQGASLVGCIDYCQFPSLKVDGEFGPQAERLLRGVDVSQAIAKTPVGQTCLANLEKKFALSGQGLRPISQAFFGVPKKSQSLADQAAAGVQAEAQGKENVEPNLTGLPQDAKRKRNMPSDDSSQEKPPRKRKTMLQVGKTKQASQRKKAPLVLSRGQQTLNCFFSSQSSSSPSGSSDAMSLSLESSKSQSPVVVSSSERSSVLRNADLFMDTRFGLSQDQRFVADRAPVVDEEDPIEYSGFESTGLVRKKLEEFEDIEDSSDEESLGRRPFTA